MISGSEEIWLPEPGCKSEDPETGLGDEGFSEVVPVLGSNRCLQRSLSELTKSSTAGKVSVLKRRNSASKVETSSSLSSLTASASTSAAAVDAKVFQQVRIALEKLPTEKLSTLIGLGPTTLDDDDVTVGGKRQKVVDAEDEDDVVKKLKLESDAKETVIKSNLNQVSPIISHLKTLKSK